MSDHATLSPSSRHRWGACAASRREEAKYPPEPSGPAAIDGTHTHTLIETCLKANLASPFDYVGKTLKNHDGEFTVDKARAARAAVCIDYVKTLLGGETTILAETRVEPGPLVGRFDMSGTVDVQVLRSDIWHVIDYKDGGGLVEVEENPQLLQYAVGVVAEALSAQRKLPNTIRLTIVQPKLVDRGIAAVRSWEITTARVMEETKTLKAQGEATDDPNAPFTPGESQCKYCRHRNNCTAKAEKVMNDLGFTQVPSAVEKVVSPMDIATQAANKNPAEMPDEQIRQIIDAAPLMRQLLESVEEEAEKRLKAGKRIPGLKLVNGRGSRAWAFPEAEMEGKLTKMGIPKGSVYVTKLVSPAQAEKLTWEKRDGTKVQLSARQLERLEKEYIVKMAGKITVVSESDSRPAITMDASPLFAPVEQTGGNRRLTSEEFSKIMVNTWNKVNPEFPIEPSKQEPVVTEPALPAWLSP